MENQSEKMMTYFDIIRHEYDRYKQKEMDRGQRLNEAKAELRKRKR